MADPALVPEHSVAQGTEPERCAPRADLHDAIGWIVLGGAVVVGSITMDRLETQNINPVTVPGLLPGLLGAAMVLLGVVLGLRSWRRGALAQPVAPATPLQREERRRVGIAVALCVGYGVVLVGHGIPFWLASSIYVTTAILVFQRLGADAAERRLTVRAWAKALLIGVLSSVVTWLVFEKLFLVRLP
jgi:hypothetical protein